MRVPVSTQRGEPYLQHQGLQILQRKTSDTSAGSQLPTEHIAEGDVLDRHSTLDADITNFHTMSQSSTIISAHRSDGGTALAGQRAIAEYQSFALMEKQSVPLYRVDEYV